MKLFFYKNSFYKKLFSFTDPNSSLPIDTASGKFSGGPGGVRWSLTALTMHPALIVEKVWFQKLFSEKRYHSAQSFFLKTPTTSSI